MLYNTMLHNTLMYVTPCYITCICYVACYITCDNTASVYICRLLAWLCAHHRLRLQNLKMVVDLLEHLSASCWTGMITTSQKTLVELEEEAVHQIHWLQCWRAYLVLLSDIPLPAAGDIPGMTVVKAIQVFHVI